MAASSYPSSYRDYQTEARDLVQALMATCLKEIAEEVPVKGIRWPKGDQFTQENCMASIEELIQSWELDKSWLHHINYTGIREMEGGGGRIVHCYCAMFSQPSRRKPVPRATASVFFFLVPPPTGESREETMVFYVIESQRVVLRPSSTFCEVWLRKVISSKLAINSSISL